MDEGEGVKDGNAKLRGFAVELLKRQRGEGALLGYNKGYMAQEQRVCL